MDKKHLSGMHNCKMPFHVIPLRLEIRKFHIFKETAIHHAPPFQFIIVDRGFH